MNTTPFIVPFSIRWNDLDPNRHVANVSYVAFMTHTRMKYLQSQGIDQAWFDRNRMGPAILNEDFHYLREVFPEETVKVDVELLGLSEDKKFIRFSHCLYNSKGQLAVYGTLLFVWINLDTRKITLAPPELQQAVDNLPKAEGFRMLTQADLRDPSVPKRRTLPQK